MAVIAVNFKELEQTAQKIRDHVFYVECQMGSRNIDTAELMQCWQGEDAKAFIEHITNMNSSGSVLKAYVSSMKSYADFLENAAKIYKSAMIDAYNEANSCAK